MPEYHQVLWTTDREPVQKTMTYHWISFQIRFGCARVNYTVAWFSRCLCCCNNHKSIFKGVSHYYRSRFNTCINVNYTLSTIYKFSFDIFKLAKSMDLSSNWFVLLIMVTSFRWNIIWIPKICYLFQVVVL